MSTMFEVEPEDHDDDDDDESEVGEISQEQKKTVSVEWNSADVGSEEDQVDLRVLDPKVGALVTVRTVDNKPDENGVAAATVTFPRKFHGSREVTVEGPLGSSQGRIVVR